MEIDQLNYFLKVAECQSFTRAAEELGISQPALSRSIQRLEEELGQPVFERKVRSLAMTDAGKLLKIRAKQVLDILADTKAEITDDGQSGVVRIGAIPTIAPYFLPDLLRAFSSSHPRAMVQVNEATTDQLIKNCSHGEIDLAILALPLATKHLDIETLFEEELYLVVPPDHELASKQEICLADTESFPFVLLNEAHCLSENVLSFCRNRSYQPVVVERTSQLATIQELVAVGHGISMVPEMAVRCDASERRVYRSIDGKSATRTIAVLWNPYRFQSRLCKAFMNTLREVSAKRREGKAY